MCQYSTSTFEHSVLGTYCPEHAEVRGNDGVNRLAGQATITSGLRLGGRSEVLRSLRHYLATGTKPRTSHHRSPGGERRGKRKRSTRFLDRTREGHRQWDEHRKCFGDNAGETSERWGGAHMSFSEWTDTILNLTEFNWRGRNWMNVQTGRLSLQRYTGFSVRRPSSTRRVRGWCTENLQTWIE